MNGKSTAHQNGTINTTTIIINGKYPLTPLARIEAYAIAIEAKCRACHDNGIMCEKDPTRVACGTGTDCCVLICPSTMSTTMTTEKMAEREKNDNVVKHAGKHTILAELVGQAVYEATSQINHD
jgi:adenosylcobinamide amidohydrolase